LASQIPANLTCLDFNELDSGQIGPNMEIMLDSDQTRLESGENCRIPVILVRFRPFLPESCDGGQTLPDSILRSWWFFRTNQTPKNILKKSFFPLKQIEY
jgi:hypothetical protein